MVNIMNYMVGPPDIVSVRCLSIAPISVSGEARGGCQGFSTPYPMIFRG